MDKYFIFNVKNLYVVYATNTKNISIYFHDIITFFLTLKKGSIMKISICYFSQTGNTLKIAKRITEGFESQNNKVICSSIKDINHNTIIDSDIIGIGSPTFECHAPTPIKTFIKSLPNLSGKKSFVFVTSAGAAGNVISDIQKLLKQKGSNVINAFLSPGEMFHPAPCIYGKSKGHPNINDLQNAKEFASTILNQIRNQSFQRSIGLKPKKGFYNIVGKITHFDCLIRLLVPKPIYNHYKCINCNKCIHECPMNTITKNPKLSIGNKCIRCYRCNSICLQKAITVNWRFGNLIILIFWNKYFMNWFGEYKKEK